MCCNLFNDEIIIRKLNHKFKLVNYNNHREYTINSLKISKNKLQKEMEDQGLSKKALINLFMQVLQLKQISQKRLEQLDKGRRRMLTSPGKGNKVFQVIDMDQNGKLIFKIFQELDMSLLLIQISNQIIDRWINIISNINYQKEFKIRFNIQILQTQFKLFVQLILCKVDHDHYTKVKKIKKLPGGAYDKIYLYKCEKSINNKRIFQ
ncbi:unnamed protein product (macronuclear) [Paramecium tetraurelia]|uniref:Protein kinase domain-containing protein n=1 Tax=Paramecium tetraurelia TaxID=5888 RepID=A0BYR5_PARTE|nr:uncharacterized protein GSPATT00033535001 [Paramecium tetraurelia]CAK63682.1 unnamed protein product [Paramecium tetraurelia]|eukprot:XP_001431080.1 hypothetical protein (macronuclear) [Paramecium tetraurelia strain d4-2]